MAQVVARQVDDLGWRGGREQLHVGQGHRVAGALQVAEEVARDFGDGVAFNDSVVDFAVHAITRKVHALPPSA